MGRLEGKVAFVTGGGKGIGKGIAIRFAAEGASVAIAQRDESTLEETAARIADAGGNALAVPTDITQPSSVADLVSATVRELGPVDVLVNNAAIAGSHGNFLETTLEVWESYMKTNLTGTFLVTQAVARGMVDAGTKGRIINIGSIQSFVAQPGFTAYGTSKGGVLMFTRLLAKDLAPHPRRTASESTTTPSAKNSPVTFVRATRVSASPARARSIRRRNRMYFVV